MSRSRWGFAIMTSSAGQVAGAGVRTRGVPRPLARLLLDAVSEDRRDQFDPATVSGVDVEMLDVATFVHKVGPAVYVHMKNAPEAPPALVAAMRHKYQTQIARQIHVSLDLAEISAVLEGLGVAWLVCKGPVLAENLWSRPDLRQYADLDVVTDRRRFGDVLDALLANGASMIDLNWELIEHKLQAEVSVRLRHGTSLDLHWNVVNDRDLRRVFRFPIDDMLSRSVRVKVGDVSVPTFDPPDTLLHLAYHTAHSGGHRLMWLKDVERAVTSPDLDWDTVMRRARTYGVDLALAIVLERVRRVIGFSAPPPPDATVAARSPWGALATVGEKWWRAPVLPGDKYSGQIVYKSVRANSLASARAALRVARTRGGEPPDPASNPLLQERGGTERRRAYLQAISALEHP